LEIFDHDTFGDDDFMGLFTIPINDLQESINNYVDKWYPVQKRHDEVVSGDIRIRYKFNDREGILDNNNEDDLEEKREAFLSQFQPPSTDPPQLVFDESSS